MYKVIISDVFATGDNTIRSIKSLKKLREIYHEIDNDMVQRLNNGETISIGGFAETHYIKKI